MLDPHPPKTNAKPARRRSRAHAPEATHAPEVAHASASARTVAPAFVAFAFAFVAACGAAFAQTSAAGQPAAAKGAAAKSQPATSQSQPAASQAKPAPTPAARARRVAAGKATPQPAAKNASRPAGESKAGAAESPAAKSNASAPRVAESAEKGAVSDAAKKKAATKDAAAKDAATKVAATDDAGERGAAKDAAEGDAKDGAVADAAKEAAGKDGTKGAAAKGAGGVEAELAELRARVKGARSEERGRLQRELVDRLVALGRAGEAQDALRLMIHEDRFDPAFFFNTGNALARLGDANAAADAYRKAVAQRRGNYARALNNLGVVLTRQGRWDEAHEVLTAALTQENFTYAEASYNLGRLHLLRGETNLAVREWSRTLRLQPGHTEAAAALARAHAEEGDAERALSVLEAFTARAVREGGAVPREISSARAAVMDSMARGADDEGLRVAAVRDAASARPASPSSAPREASTRPGASPLRPFGVDRLTYDALRAARDASERGRHEEAVRYYRSALSRSGGNLPPASLELSFALITLGRDAEAVASLQALVARYPVRYPAAHYHLARLYERTGQPLRAAEHFARAAELYGDANPQVLLDLSRTREKANDARGALEALEAYQRAAARQGSVPDWVAERADALRAKLKTAQVK